MSNNPKYHILDTVQNSHRKLTPQEIAKAIVEASDNFKGRDVRNGIRELVNSGDLAYTNMFGRTFVECSFNKPVKISDRITLSPPDNSYEPGIDEIVVRLQHGASFGTGSHPTTRLCLKSLDFAFNKDFSNLRNGSALDIGTGSGVLAIASVLLGMDNATGLDIDPCSISEARTNVTLNNLDDKISISDLPIEEINGSYNLILANLRYPTIRSIYSKLVDLTLDNAAIIISGIKDEELDGVNSLYSERYFKKIYQECEKGWASIAFVKS